MTKQEALQHYPNISLIIFAMLLFLGIFTTMIIRVMKKSNKSYYETAAQLPLAKENGHE